MKKEMVKIVNDDGITVEVELVTFLVNDDASKSFIVYTKGETQGPEQDKVIYISKFVSDGTNLTLTEITDNSEWNEVLGLLKKVANAK